MRLALVSLNRHSEAKPKNPRAKRNRPQVDDDMAIENVR